MNPSANHATSAQRTEELLRVGLIAFALLNLALAALMALSPSTFFSNLGPFGARNNHYIRDVSSFYLAMAVALAVAVRRPAWRAPVLGLVCIQSGFHAVNHLADIGHAHPYAYGPIDFGALVLATVTLAWLWRLASSPSDAAAATRDVSRVRREEIVS